MDQITMPTGIPLWELSKLKPYEKNARTHSQEQVEQIAASIVEFGFTNPILVDEKDGIIAGHGRLMAANHLGLAKVPVIVLSHMTEAQKRAYIIADNQLALKAGWDEGLLRKELEALEQSGFDLSLVGFSEEELSEIMPEASRVEEAGDEEAIPEVMANPVSRLGDIWALGKHRLLCGDCTSIDNVQKLMGDLKADMVFIDPPYNVALGMETPEEAKRRNRRTDGKTVMNDKMDNEAFYQFLRDAFVSLFTAAKPGAAIYVAHADSEGLNFRKALIDAGWLLKQCLIWVKQSIVMGRQDYHWQHEPILYGWASGGSHTWYGDRKQSTVWNFDKPSKSEDHPTMKPVALVEQAILNSSERAQIVIDTFGGSGTTLIACEKNGRKSRTMELDPKYVDVAVRRWQEYTGKKAILEETGQSFDDLEAERTHTVTGPAKKA